jgi:tetratricopeptide (TPR) repeat protein
MKISFHYQLFVQGALLLLISWLCVGVSGIAWAETAEQEAQTTLKLADGTVITLTETAVIRKQSESEKAVLWTIPAKEPQLPVTFENSAEVRLLLYFAQISDYYGEFRAIRLQDGQREWVHPVWLKSGRDTPVLPVFLSPWIYFGRGMWLEKMDPDDGKIVARYPARVAIRSLEPLPDGAIAVYTESGDTGKVTLNFQHGQFEPHIVAPGDFISSLDLSQRGEYVAEDFVGTLNDGYLGYLDIHRIKREPLAREFETRWKTFDLRAVERTYQHASQEDLANPYFSLYLALSVYYQNRQTEAEPYFQDALTRSAGFWEESLRLGGICESLKLTQWADAFYEQGTARYFQEVPAPPHDVWLVEALIHFSGQRQTGILYAHGRLNRALHVLEVRRQIFPYTEGDALFSSHYAPWLRRMGREDLAVLEEQRLQHAMFLDVFEPFSPSSFLGFLFIGLLVLGVIIWKNEGHAPSEMIIALIAMVLIGTTIAAKGMKTGWGTIIVLIVLLLVYSSIMAFLRKRRLSSSSPLWRMLLNIMTSSYIVLLTGIFVAYAVGERLSGSPLGGKAAEIGYILLFIGYHYWVRRGSSLSEFRNGRLFAVVCIVLWGYLVWFHVFISLIAIEAALPIPLADRGHPSWIAYVDQQLEEARFQNSTLLFTQALAHHLGGDVEFARQIYEDIPDDARAANNLGVMLLNKESNGARAYFEHALECEPNFAPALYNLGLLDGDRARIERARTADRWRVDAYQKYVPDKPWIAMSPIRKWDEAVYWSQGGFLTRGFIEIIFQNFSPFSWIGVLS